MRDLSVTQVDLGKSSVMSMVVGDQTWQELSGPARTACGPLFDRNLSYQQRIELGVDAFRQQLASYIRIQLQEEKVSEIGDLSDEKLEEISAKANLLEEVLARGVEYLKESDGLHDLVTDGSDSAVLGIKLLGEVRSPRALKALCELGIQSKDDAVVQATVQILQEVGDSVTLAWLRAKAIRGTTEQIRIAAALTLSGRMDSVTLQVLEVLLNKDPSFDVRKAATRALFASKEPGQSVLCKRGLDSTHQELRSFVIELIKGSEEPLIHNWLRKKGVIDHSASIRSASLQIIGAASGEGDLPLFITALKDPTNVVRETAAEILNRASEAAVYSKIMEVYKEGSGVNRGIKSACLKALRNCKRKDFLRLLAEDPLQTDSKDLRIAAAEGLSGTVDAELIKALWKRYTIEPLDQVKLACVKAIAASNHPDATDLCVKILKQSTDPVFRAASLEGLVRSKDPAIQQLLLLTSKKDNSAAVRDAALALLSSVGAGHR